MTDLAASDWRLVGEESWEGPMNMALDEVAAETAADGGPRTLRVYRWDPSTLSLGYHQDPATIDWDYCEQAGITVTRRPTGGGAIYHDGHGDISYSIVAPAAELPGDLLDSYELLCTPVFDAFARLGVDASFASEERPAIYEPACYLRALHPAHDVVAADGRKLSGNAQYRRRESVIQHGSLTFERLADRHCSVFATDDLSPETFRERVTAIDQAVDCDRRSAVAALKGSLKDWADASDGAWTPDELERARTLAADKYASEAWTRRGEDPT